jgi:hypothetical protein
MHLTAHLSFAAANSALLAAPPAGNAQFFSASKLCLTKLIKVFLLPKVLTSPSMYAHQTANLVGRVYKSEKGALVRKKRHHLLALSVFWGGLAAAALVPMAAAHADDCSLGFCSLISGGEPSDVAYAGFRPLATEWTSNQPVNVEVTENGTSFVSGSYNVAEQDFASPLWDENSYTYSTFLPAADNATGIDSDGLSGASINDLAYGPGQGLTAAGPTYLFNNLDVQYANGMQIEVTTGTNEFTNVFAGTSTESGDWLLMPGDSTPILLWDSLPSPSIPEVSDLLSLLPPDLWGPDWASAFPPGLI